MDALRLAHPGRMRQPFIDAGVSVLDLLDAQDLEGALDGIRRDVLQLASDQGASPEAGPAGSGSDASAVDAKGSPAGARGGALSALTDREAEILVLLADRLSNKEIGKRLFISPATVKRHAATLYGKLGVHGRRDAVDRARSLGLLRSVGERY